MARRGAVLCGGASRRMGRDKALLQVDGVALARRVADVLVASGCSEVVAIGGDASALGTLGLPVVPDRWPGEGPLGGLATALGAAAVGDVVVVAPCDLVAPSAAVVAALLRALDADAGVDVAAPEVGGRAEWVLAAWRVRAGLADEVAALVDGGARRLDAVAAVASRRTVPSAPDALADADTPDDLLRRRRGGRRRPGDPG